MTYTPGQRCTAKRSNGTPCRAYAVKGLEVCVKHGGASKVARAAGARRVAEAKAAAQAARAVATLGLPVAVSPSEALLAEVQRAAGHVAWLGAKVAELEEVTSAELSADGVTTTTHHQLTWGTTKVTRKTGDTSGVDVVQEGRVSVWYELYARERAALVRASEAALRAGVEERRIALAEQQGLAVAGMLRTVLEALWVRLLDRAEAPPTREVWEAAVGEIAPSALRQLANA